MVIHGIVVGMALSATCSAENFSVDLERLAEIEVSRSIPKYTLDRVLTKSMGNHSDMPEKTFDVVIRFEEFGELRLSSTGEAGPSAGQNWKKGAIYRAGLANLAEVKGAWIRNSPDFFIVAWVEEPDGRGNGNQFSHGYLVMQLRGQQARILLRGKCAITARVRAGIQQGTLQYSRFSFELNRGLLEEKVTRRYEKASDRPHELSYRRKDEGGRTIFVATIHETIVLTYALVDGRLRPQSCRLTYITQKHDRLSEVARYYLGPFATSKVLLEANEDLLAKYGDNPSGALIYLDTGLELEIPVPEKWLADEFGHGLTMSPETD